MDLKAKGWPDEPSCKTRGELESAKHLLLGVRFRIFASGVSRRRKHFLLGVRFRISTGGV